MKKQTWIHGISLLLAFLLLFGATSCSRQDLSRAPEERIRLTVEELDVEYSEEFSEQSSRRAAEILARFLFMNDGLSISEDEKEQLAQRIQTDYLPLFLSERVREEELEQLLAHGESFCSALEELTSGEPKELRDRKIFFFGEWYRNMIATIGTERTGRVVFGGISFYLDEQIRYYEERYEQYGFSFYQLQVEMLTDRKTALTEEIGAEIFTKAMSVPAFLTSVSAGALWVEDEQLSSLLYDGDLVAILRRQGDYFCSLGITEYQWLLIGEVFSVFGSDGGEDLLGEELCILRDLGILADGGACVPKLLTLYSAFADALDAKTLAAIRDADTRDVRAMAFCSVLSKCREEFFALSAQFEMMCATSDSRELEAIENKGLLEEFAKFEKDYTVMDAEAFFEVVSACAEGREDADSVERAFLCTLRGTAPYLAFAIFSNG